ncbi:MAG TPA: ABC transporter permease [Candidatus Mediterraneibacter stercoravium]|uniref:ABC transporter permease n=1 Tax=Candidatus Mediterraneibacter stercoravium TaxID=2838685 RepID=A0A9D2G646_9FIRM|nr:ABC transporter permease [Candidatus Mediterraneibacter stercoravium]
MGKLIKYEWKKQRMSRMVILIGLGVCLLLFLGGLLFQSDLTLAASILLLAFGSILVLFYTGIESILVLNRDLRTRQSYMLWMVPKSVWEILGAKYICAFLQMLFVFGLFVAAACICSAAALFSSGGIQELAKAVETLVQALTNEKLDWGMILINLIWFAVYMLIGWTEVILVGFLAVIISRTVLIRSKLAGFLSVILFFVIIYLVERGLSLLGTLPWGYDAGIGGRFVLWQIVYYLFVSIILFLISGWLSEKKLSV